MSSDSTVDPYATADPYATDAAYGDDTTSSEEAAAPEEVKNPTMLYFGWGLIHIWMTVLGFLVYTWYPKLLTSNAWWANQCPTTLWTTANITTTTSLTTGTATVTQVNNTWTNSTCLKAAPVSQWSTLAYTMLIGDGLVSLIWLLNTIIGNNGGMLHMIFWRTSQASALLALLVVAFEVIAMMSYGAKTAVLNSWFGYPSATYAAATAGAGTLTSGTITTGWTTTTSDFKYLMWKDTSAVVPNSTDYSIYG